MILNAPDGYMAYLGELPANVAIAPSLDNPLDFIHFFTTQQQELAERFPALKRALAKSGMLWISWPKKSSKITTDLNEDIIREIGLSNHLVDVKVCAVNENWSALKFVYRLEDRKR